MYVRSIKLIQKIFKFTRVKILNKLQFNIGTIVAGRT